VDKQKLYNRIDAEDEISDKEKLQAYFDAIEEDAAIEMEDERDF
jgi:hypothetical protein